MIEINFKFTVLHLGTRVHLKPCNRGYISFGYTEVLQLAWKSVELKNLSNLENCYVYSTYLHTYIYVPYSTCAYVDWNILWKYIFLLLCILWVNILTAFLGRIKQIERRYQEGDNNAVKLKRFQLTGFLKLWNY